MREDEETKKNYEIYIKTIFKKLLLIIFSNIKHFFIIVKIKITKILNKILIICYPSYSKQLCKLIKRINLKLNLIIYFLSIESNEAPCFLIHEHEL